MAKKYTRNQTRIKPRKSLDNGMIPTLQKCSYANLELDPAAVIALNGSKHRALAILHDCPQVVPDTISHLNSLATLPDVGRLKFDQPSAAVWLASAVKALIEANGPTAGSGIDLERYAAIALEHAGRILKHAQGLQDGYKEHVDQAAATLEVNRQKAEVAKAKKGRATEEAILECYKKLLKESGNRRGNQAEVALRLGITHARVSQVLGKRKFPR